MSEFLEKNFPVLLMIAYHNKTNPDYCTNTDLVDQLGLSQQTISRRLIQLEKDSFIIRKFENKGQIIQLTEKGSEFLESIYQKLNLVLSHIKDEDLFFDAEYVQGIGEGAFYVELEPYFEQFTALLGAPPYAGTFNLYLSDEGNQRERYYDSFKMLNCKKIKGFKTEKRTYGAVECFDAYLCREDDPDRQKKVLILNIHRTSHNYGVIEVVSETYLRDYFSVKEGDFLRLKLIN